MKSEVQNTIDGKVQDYLERASEVLSNLDWTPEDDHPQLEIAKMIQKEQQFLDNLVLMKFCVNKEANLRESENSQKHDKGKTNEK